MDDTSPRLMYCQIGFGREMTAEHALNESVRTRVREMMRARRKTREEKQMMEAPAVPFSPSSSLHTYKFHASWTESEGEAERSVDSGSLCSPTSQGGRSPTSEESRLHKTLCTYIANTGNEMRRSVLRTRSGPGHKVVKLLLSALSPDTCMPDTDDEALKTDLLRSLREQLTEMTSLQLIVLLMTEGENEEKSPWCSRFATMQPRTSRRVLSLPPITGTTMPSKARCSSKGRSVGGRAAAFGNVGMSPSLAGSVRQALRSKRVVQAVVDLLERHQRQFALGEELLLHCEALRALRVLLMPEQTPICSAAPPPCVANAADRIPAGNVVPEEIQKLMTGLVKVLLRSSLSVGESLSYRPLAACLGTLWSLAVMSGYCRRLLEERHATDLVLSVLRRHSRTPPPSLNELVKRALCGNVAPLPCASVLTNACSFLAAASWGAFALQRLADSGAERDAMDLLRRYPAERTVCCAALMLFGAVCREPFVTVRVAEMRGICALVRAHCEMRPDEAERAYDLLEQPVPALVAAMWDTNSRQSWSRGKSALQSQGPAVRLASAICATAPKSPGLGGQI